MLGKGYESLGQTLLKSMKFTHILHFLFYFLTKTTFVDHSGYWISRMWPAATSFLVSSRMTRLFSSLNFLLLYTTGLTFSSMVSRWHKKSGSITNMSTDDHAKTFRFTAITSAILSSNSLPSVVSFLNFFPFIFLS